MFFFLQFRLFKTKQTMHFHTSIRNFPSWRSISQIITKYKYTQHTLAARLCLSFLAADFGRIVSCSKGYWKP